MYDFISFLCERDEDLYYHHLEVVLERSVADVESNPPKDGRWESEFMFTFNVEGDEDGLGEIEKEDGSKIKKNRYKVNFSTLESPSISFSRDGSYSDNRGGFGQKVFDGVFYAIWEFIKKNRPGSIGWAPVSRSSNNPVTGQMVNRDAREKAYEIFSIKSLFPDYYVSVDKNIWISRKKYEEDYVPKGYPAIPNDLKVDSNPGAKKKFLEIMRSKHTEKAKEFVSRTSSPISQPNVIFPTNAQGREFVVRTYGLKVGDKVTPKISEKNIYQSQKIEFYRINSNHLLGLERELQRLAANGMPIFGKIKEILEFEIEDSTDYAASVEFEENGRKFNFYIKDLSLYSEQEANRIGNLARNPIDVALANPLYNREGYKVGSDVIDSDGYMGKIQRITFSNPRHSYEMRMNIIWNQQQSLLPGSQNPRQTNFPLQDGNIMLATPENIQHTRQHIADLQAQTQRRAQAQASRPHNPNDPDDINRFLQSHD